MPGVVDDNRKYIYPVVITTAILILPALSGHLGWLQSFVPLPIFYYLTVFGEKTGGRIFVTASLVAGGLGLATGTLHILLYSFLLAPLGFLLAHGMRERQDLTRTAFRGTILLAVLWVLFAIFYGTVKGSNPYQEIVAGVDAELVATNEVLQRQYSDLPLDTKAELEATLLRVRQLMPRIVPGLLGIMLLTTVWLNVALGQHLLVRRDQRPTPWGNLREWRLPEGLIWGAIGAGFMMLVPLEPVSNTGLNLLLVFATLYFFQGLAVIADQLARWRTPQPVRVIIYVLLLFLQLYGLVLVTGLGVADIWRRKKTEQQDDSTT